MALDNPSYFTMANPPPLCSLSSSVSSTSSCSSPRSQTKRSLRSLLRSLSTNSADSNHELFNTGAPRLSDIAPEFKYPLEPRRANSLKNNRARAEHRRSGGIYSPLPTQAIDAIDSIDSNNDDDEDDHDEDEVFLTHEDDSNVRYYNVKHAKPTTTTTTGDQTIAPRRHSISTLRTARSNSNNNIEQRQRSSIDLPHGSQAIEGQSTASSSLNIQIDDHKLRHGSYPRKRCNRCPRGITKRTDMEDILIVSAKDSEPANLWAQYFASYFEQISQNANRKPYRIRHLGIEEIIANNGDVRHIAERTTCVKLQLIIICPLFLERIHDHPQYSSTGLTKLLLPDRILALQLGTNDEDISDVHKEALPSFQQWQRRPVGQDQDQNFALEFVSTAIGIFTKIWKQQSSIASEENSQFSIAPKKIRYGQTSVLILLEYPLQHEDIIKINIVKNEEMTEIKNVKRRNPYTLKFTIPEKFLEVSAIVNILVEKNGSFIGRRPIKCESRLRELEQILRSTNNPIEFMCQSLGFSPHDTEQLDNWLVLMFQKNVPPNFALFVNDSIGGGSKHVCELFPTLLHFAARFGLGKLTAQLLDCPGGDLACEIRNVQDFTPADIAENIGHKEINNMLRGYMKMNELAVVYTKIKKLTTDKQAQEKLTLSMEDPEEHYLIPKKPQTLVMEEFYKMCPAPKPFLSQSAPSTPVTEDEHSLTHYIAMDQKKSESLVGQDQNYQNFPMTQSNASVKSSGIETPRSESSQNLQEPKKKHRHHSSMQSILSKNSSLSKSSMNEDKVQVELAEIINDFKNNVHTIAQTEQLVAEWQNRNDVQKSFKEKQDQLKEMRLRYEKIQRDLKHNGKKSSPFERFKKIFGWAQHGQHQHCIKEEMEFKAEGHTRPISSLSLQSTASSSSSGRMSTISGCSLGDSGTHSDHEERKITLHTPIEEDTSLSHFNNYLIPPTPRPVKGSLMTVREHLDSFYIQFPPNGLPVIPAGDEVDHNKNSELKTEHEPFLPHQEYMNFPVGLGCNSIDQQQQHDYMNFKTVSS